MKNLIFSFMLLLSISSFAQDRGIVNGVLQDDTEFIEFAALILRASTDSAIVKTSLSDSLGKYEFLDVPYGDYFVEVSHLGYDAYYTETFTFNQPNYNIPNIMLSVGATTLQTAVVTSSRPFIVRKIDRTIVNVEGSLLSSGGSAVDVLEMSPGLVVNRDGNISMAGKNGVMVFIDGKRSYLSGNDLVNFLESLSSEQLAQIEIMSNPPASYDAAGNAGVINIKTKKLKLKGYNGSVSSVLKYGKYPGATLNGNFNYRNKNFNLFGNVSLIRQKTFDDYKITRNLRDFNTLEIQTIFDQETRMIPRSNNVNATLGIDYYLGDNTTVGVTGNVFVKRGDGEMSNTTMFMSPEEVISQTIIAPVQSVMDWDNYNVNVNLSHNFDSTNHSLFIDFDHMSYNTLTEQIFDNNYFEGSIEDGELPFLSELSQNLMPQEIGIYSAKADYIRPVMAERGTFEFGVKSSYVETDNLVQFSNQVDNQWVLNENLSNDFQYSEFINAAYSNLRLKLSENLTAQAGLRIEHTNAEGVQLTTNESFENNYLQLFPTVYFAYNLGEMHTLNLNYGRRIQRPAYEDMNPFRIYLDQFTYEEGNPNLQPQISDNFELSYSGLGGAFSAKVYHNRINDVIQETIFQNLESNETFLRPENLAKSQLTGFQLQTSLEMSKFLNPTFYFNLYNEQISGQINELPFAIKQGTFQGIFINKMKLPNSWGIDVGAWYTSKSIVSTFIREPYGRISAAVQKKLMDNKLQVRFSVNDIFRWNRFVATSQFQNIDIFLDNRWETLKFRLSFNYKFSQGSVKNKKSRASGIETEQSRVKLED